MRVVIAAELAQHRDQAPQVEDAVAAARRAADRAALVEERGDRDLPPLVDLTEAVGVGHHHVAQEDLVEVRAPGHLPQRADFDTGRVHVDHEGGEVPVPRPRCGPRQEQADVGEVGPGGPHLLAVDHPLVTAPLRLGGDRGEVGSRARLAEELATDGVAAVDGAQPALLGLPRPELLEDRPDHPQADPERGPGRRVVFALQLQIRLLVAGGQPAPAPLDRPGDPAEAGVEDGPPPDPGLLDLLGRCAPEEGHPVVAFAPGLVHRAAAARGLVEEGPRLGEELLQAGMVLRFLGHPFASLLIDHSIFYL